MNGFESLIKFLNAQEEAEKKGDNEFICPICGGTAKWTRSSYNNHLHAHCCDCGFLVMQ